MKKKKLYKFLLFSINKKDNKFLDKNVYIIFIIIFSKVSLIMHRGLYRY
jgi:hypothetical protein